MKISLSATLKSKMLEIISRVCALLIKAGLRIRKPVVFCYHGVGESDDLFCVGEKEFEEQMSFIKKLGEVVTVNNLLKNIQIADNLISVTFDDGLKSVYTKAFPIMRKLGIAGCVFVNGINVLGDESEKYLTMDEMKELKKNGWEIGYHTWSHKNLNKLSDKKLKDEIARGRGKIQKGIDLKILYFAYPFGVYTKGVMKLVSRSNYKTAFSVDGLSARGRNNFNVSRVIVDRTTSKSSLLALTTSLGLFVNRVFVWIFRKKDEIYALLSKDMTENYAKI